MSLFYYPYPASAPIVSVPLLVEINANMVPIIISAMERYKYRQFWASEADFNRGVQLINECEVALLTGVTGITDAIDRVYRLLDTALNGAVYSVETSAPLVVTPEIPPVPSAFQPTTPEGLRSQLARIHQLSENLVTGAELSGAFAMDGASNLDWGGSLQARIAALQGEINEGWFGIGGQPATVADIVRSLAVGNDDDVERITGAIDAISGNSGIDVGDAATVLNTVRDLFTDTASLTGEGAILGTLIAGSIATSGMLGHLASKLDAVVTALSQIVPLVTALDEVEASLADIRTLLQ